MSRAQRQVEFEKVSQVPECPKWEYTNDAGELELMKESEKQHREKNNATELRTTSVSRLDRVN
jgi:hypothetical protein